MSTTEETNSEPIDMEFYNLANRLYNDNRFGLLENDNERFDYAFVCWNKSQSSFRKQLLKKLAQEIKSHEKDINKANHFLKSGFQFMKQQDFKSAIDSYSKVKSNA